MLNKGSFISRVSILHHPHKNETCQIYLLMFGSKYTTVALVGQVHCSSRTWLERSAWPTGQPERIGTSVTRWWNKKLPNFINIVQNLQNHFLHENCIIIESPKIYGYLSKQICYQEDKKIAQSGHNYGNKCCNIRLTVRLCPHIGNYYTKIILF